MGIPDRRDDKTFAKEEEEEERGRKCGFEEGGGRLRRMDGLLSGMGPLGSGRRDKHDSCTRRPQQHPSHLARGGKGQVCMATLTEVQKQRQKEGRKAPYPASCGWVEQARRGLRAAEWAHLFFILEFDGEKEGGGGRKRG